MERRKTERAREAGALLEEKRGGELTRDGLTDVLGFGWMNIDR